MRVRYRELALADLEQIFNISMSATQRARSRGWSDCFAIARKTV